eukprot:1289328-Pleurochrysis_carterae.AAC.1
MHLWLARTCVPCVHARACACGLGRHASGLGGGLADRCRGRGLNGRGKKGPFQRRPELAARLLLL